MLASFSRLAAVPIHPMILCYAAETICVAITQSTSGKGCNSHLTDTTFLKGRAYSSQRYLQAYANQMVKDGAPMSLINSK